MNLYRVWHGHILTDWSRSNSASLQAQAVRNKGK